MNGLFLCQYIYTYMYKCVVSQPKGSYAGQNSGQRETTKANNAVLTEGTGLRVENQRAL